MLYLKYELYLTKAKFNDSDPTAVISNNTLVTGAKSEIEQNNHYTLMIIALKTFFILLNEYFISFKSM